MNGDGGPNHARTSEWLHDFQDPTEGASNHLNRGDTLDRNPICVNPNDQQLTKQQQQQQQQQMVIRNIPQNQFIKVEASPQHQQQQQQQQQATTQFIYDGSKMIQVVQTEAIAGEWELNNDPLQQQQQQQQQQQDQPHPTCATPSNEPWPGPHKFRVNIQPPDPRAKNRTYDYSTILNKLFIDMNKDVQINFSAVNVQRQLYIRALPIYAIASYYTEAVKRCPNHASPADSSNKGFPQDLLLHLIRIKHDAAKYDENTESGRLSVVVPFDRPQAGSEFSSHFIKFMCLGSDVGGINRKPVKVIFTLEDSSGTVMGRSVVDIRICSCPKRDKGQEEKKAKEALQMADSLARSNSVVRVAPAPHQGKKRKLEQDEYVMVPVLKSDYERIDYMAYAMAFEKYPERANKIKEERKKLFE